MITMIVKLTRCTLLYVDQTSHSFSVLSTDVAYLFLHNLTQTRQKKSRVRKENHVRYFEICHFKFECEKLNISKQNFFFVCT